MKAWVEYNVPVLALVNTETREVERVVERIEEMSSPVAYFEDDGTGPNGKQIMRHHERKALRIIADESVWPAWEAGF